MNPINLETKGKRMYIDYKNDIFNGLYIETEEPFNSDDYDFYRSELDDKLYNSTCYLVLNKTVNWGIFKDQKTPIYKFKIANVPYYEEDRDYDNCIGILISEFFILDPLDQIECEITCYAKGIYNTTKEDLKGIFGYNIATARKFDNLLNEG